jgi:hypothetical protein
MTNEQEQRPGSAHDFLLNVREQRIALRRTRRIRRTGELQNWWTNCSTRVEQETFRDAAVK